MRVKDEGTQKVIKDLGHRIRALRQKKFSNYEKFAYTHDIARVVYWRWENGQDMRISSILKIAKAHGITLRELFSEGFDV